jgi:hypothetical protein
MQEVIDAMMDQTHRHAASGLKIRQIREKRASLRMTGLVLILALYEVDVAMPRRKRIVIRRIVTEMHHLGEFESGQGADQQPQNEDE